VIDGIEHWTMISIDEHLIKPENTWTSRVSSRYKQRCPHVVRNADGAGWSWVYDDNRYPFNGLECAIGQEPSERSDTAEHYERCTLVVMTRRHD
jgi:hypothetical protein